MKQENIGKTISKLRKENNLTQEELGNILGVSSKTISKWECNNSIPDITIIKKISKEFNVSIDEILECSKKELSNKKTINNNKVILLILLLVLIIFTIIYFNNKSSIKNPIKNQKENNCTVIKTYDIINIKNSNDKNYTYITISEFQTEGTYTIKISKILTKNIKENNSYIFTFKTSKEYLKSNSEILFNNSDIINIEYTNKIGLERDSYSYCDKLNN